MSQNSTYFVKKQQEAFLSKQDSLHLANLIFNVKKARFGKKHCWRAPVAINFRHAPNGARRRLRG
jgi:hypothetical protein